MSLSEPIHIIKGVKQGCVLAPTLFSIVSSMMLKQATDDLDDEDWVYVRYRLDCSLTKTQVRLIRDLLFADDAVVCYLLLFTIFDVMRFLT